MTSLAQFEIPSAFIRQDTRTTDDDQFINVHDVQTAYKNVNAIIAKRLRYPMITIACVANGGSGDPVAFDGWGPIHGGNGQERCMGPWTIWVPPYTKSLDLRVRAQADSNGDVHIYPLVSSFGFGGVQQISDDAKITVTGTSEDEYSVEVPVPHVVQNAGWGMLSIYYVSEMGEVPEVSEIPILDAGSTFVGDFTAGTLRSCGWFETSSDLNIGYILVCDNTSVLPLQIEDKQAISGGNYRYTMSGPWSVTPTTADTFDAYVLAQLQLYSITCTPNRITDFDGQLPVGI